VLAFGLSSSCAIRVSQQGYLHMMCADSDGEPPELVVDGAPAAELVERPTEDQREVGR